jgi:cytochrome b subunit of formate dehydrogenase/mono/diheme cytochrome c family protein
MNNAQTAIRRFSVFERIEHFVLILSFTTLGLTGLPQKYVLSPISQAVIGFLGGIETTRIIHHTAAAIFLIEAIYHLFAVGYKIYVRRKAATMLPGIKDATDAYQWFGYNLGFINKLPKMPRYNFMEKAEYWAMLWGLLIMGLTGLMLWNPIATTKLLPGDFIPAAKAAHGGEAVLAGLAIILWHFYNVHIKHWNWGMIKGTITRHEMEEEHGQELEQIETGKLPSLPPTASVRQRQIIFAPAAVVISLVLLGVVYYFLTFETTSLTTLPPAEQVQVYVRQTPTVQPPTPTARPKQPTATGLPQQPASGTEVVWTGTIDGMLKDKCGSCHGTSGGFSAETYDDVMKVVQPGSPDNSKIIQIQAAGDHPGQLTADELSTLTNWIQGGALKGGPGTQAAPASTGTETWDSGIGTLFTSTCGGCHGDSGGFTATTYDDVMKQIKPGDPDNSKVVEVQKAGGHPGSFTDQELTRVIDWIKVGAPQQ